MEHEEIGQLLKENRQILEENKRLLEQNNDILRKMRRSAIWGFWFRIVWILILLGLPIFIYFYLLQPLLESLSFGNMSSSQSDLSIPIEQFQQYLDQLSR